MFTMNDFKCINGSPLPYEAGEVFWNDPYISTQMLKAHLSPDTEAASYTSGKRQAICDYLFSAMKLEKGDSLVDLGCGPGLYCSVMAQEGISTTGIDFSENSIQYASEQPYETPAHFIHDSYLNPFGKSCFSAAMMIYEDYGVLSPENRKVLLKNIHTALKPNGYFALDVSSMAAFKKHGKDIETSWYASEAGFWRPHPHLVLQKTIFYPEISARCESYAVCDTEMKIYRIWQTFFTPETIQAELEESGFRVEKLLSSLTGEPYRNDSPAIGVVCTKI